MMMEDKKEDLITSDHVGGEPIEGNMKSPKNNNNNSISNNGTSANQACLKKFKGVKVCCGDLRKYLYDVETYRQASMLRKGREVHKIYVDVHKGVSFLDDRFSLTEFGRMVLENGSVRAGRARNVRQIVVARETLYCSGTGGCKRACGGYGACVSGCDKIKVRGHKCSFRVKLTMRLGFVDHWFVEVLGSHNCYIEEGSTPPTDMATMLADYETKSSDGEDSNISALNSSQRASPLPDPGTLMAVSQNGAHFLSPPNPSSSSPSLAPPSLPSLSSSMLISPAHCPLNVPIFPESYLMTVARNAAAAVAMSNSRGGQSGERSSPLGLHRGREHSISPDMIVPEIMNGYLPGSLLPGFGLLPPSNTSTPNLPSMESGLQGTDSSQPLDAIDLSTPKVKTENNSSPYDLTINLKKSMNLPLSLSRSPVPSRKSPSCKQGAPKLHSNGHERKIKSPSIMSPSFLNGSMEESTVLKPKTNGFLTNGHHPQHHHIGGSPIPTPLAISPPGVASTGPASLFNAFPSPVWSSALSALPTALVSNSTGSATNSRVRKPPTKLNPKGQQKSPLTQARTLFQDGGFAETGEEKLAAVQQNLAAILAEEVDKDLVNRVQQLEAHVVQLRNIVMKADGTKVEGQGRRKPQREFDFTKYNTRHVALKVAYLGWDYQGFVVQEDTDKTIEAALFEALLKTRLVESRETSNYHRCGRTDKGVSALGQVISLDLRTNLLTGVGVKVRDGGTAHTREGDTNTEIRYVHILNKVLPPEIRVLAWAPVDPAFSARFSCKKRTYKYYFPKGNLDLDKMNEAASALVGEHDYRNLCKMDVGNGVVNFTRKILKAEVVELDSGENGYSMCELTVVGQAFLWHQIRCIVSVLFLVAQGKEDTSIVSELLDVEKNPRKPQYSMASELPLVLFDCDFGDDLEWVYEADWHEDNIKHLQQMWAQHTIRATMLKRMLQELDEAKVETESDIAPWNELSAPILQQSDWMIPGNKPRVYKPLFKRQLCESLEERVEYYAKRRKLAENESESKEASESETAAAATENS